MRNRDAYNDRLAYYRRRERLAVYKLVGWSVLFVVVFGWVAWTV